MSEHTHTLPDGSVITHSHGEHGHTHSHTQTKAVLNRLSRAIGHLESVRRMVADGRDCTEVLIQLAAVRSALNNTAKVILKDHIGPHAQRSPDGFCILYVKISLASSHV